MMLAGWPADVWDIQQVSVTFAGSGGVTPVNANVVIPARIRAQMVQSWAAQGRVWLAGIQHLTDLPIGEVRVFTSGIGADGEGQIVATACVSVGGGVSPLRMPIPHYMPADRLNVRCEVLTATQLFMTVGLAFAILRPCAIN